MGRSPCCAKGVNKGAWSLQEDEILINFIQTHGQGKWRSLPQKAGLKRCGRSCRLRWLNYLRPDIKRGDISADEEDLIIRLHSLLGNRWALIAKRLPGRTDNEIKNYWNTNLAKKFQGKKSKLPINPKPAEDKYPIEKSKMKTQSKSVNQSETSIPPQEFRLSTSQNENLAVDDDSFNFLMEINVGDVFIPDVDFSYTQGDQMNFHMSNINHVTGEENDLSPSEDDNVHGHEMKCVLSSELKRVASFLELEDE